MEVEEAVKARILVGDVLEKLRTLADESVHCVVTSPPYWGLRNYGIPASIWPVQRSQGVVRCSNGDHLWGDMVTENATNHTDKRRWQHTRNGRDEEQPSDKRVAWLRTEVPQGQFCSLCGAWAGCFGLEPTPELYVEHSVTIFREIRRVLRKDGSLWLNLGDSYSNDTKWGGTSGGKNYTSAAGGYQGQRVRRGKDCDPKRGPAAPGQPFQANNSGLKPKDLVGMPWRVAFALQADGWWLRQWMPWIKRNSMPESCEDRPGTSVETMFLLSQSARYFYDHEAVKMPAAGTAHDRGNGVNPKALHNATRKDRAKADHMRGPTEMMNGIRPRQNDSFSAAVNEVVLARGRRQHDWFIDSWQGLLTDDAGEPLALVVNPAPFPDAHFATFPPALVEPCILAGTSEKGCCLACEAPWERIVENKPMVIDRSPRTHEMGRTRTSGTMVEPAKSITVGWQPTCDCEGPQKTVPCKVLDPFGGSGTTAMVALRYHRDAILVELNPGYAAMAQRRIKNDAPMFNEVTTA